LIRSAYKRHKIAHSYFSSQRFIFIREHKPWPSTFLATLTKTQCEASLWENKRFIIETHSDYLVDRLRMDVRDKKTLSADEIVILYFEQSRDRGQQIHPLYLDHFGNLINAPLSYRQFFLSEERRFLGG